MELIKIVNARQVIDGFAEKEDLGAHLTYWLTKFIAKTQSEGDFYLREMKKICDKYGETKEDGSLFVPADKLDEFNTEIEKLGKTEVEAPGITFSLSELARELKISMKQMYPLLDFINENE